MEFDLRTMIEEHGDLAIQYGLDLIGALLLLVGGWIVAGWVKRLLLKNFERIRGAEPTVTRFIANLARYLVLIVALIAVLGQFGVQIASILAVLGTIGLGVGLALQGTLSNIAGGIVLLFLRPFSVGDYVEAGGNAGTVMEIGLFNTELKTFDGIFRTVPNADIAASAITNYSRHPTRRLDLAVGVAYGDDLDKGLAVLSGLLEADPRILQDPAPEVMVLELADSSVNLNLRCWCKAEDFWAVKWDLTRKMKLEIEAAGLNIPFPQQDVHMHQVGGRAA